jgi:hypothetical protein
MVVTPRKLLSCISCGGGLRISILWGTPRGSGRIRASIDPYCLLFLRLRDIVQGDTDVVSINRDSKFGGRDTTTCMSGWRWGETKSPQRTASVPSYNMSMNGAKLTLLLTRTACTGTFPSADTKIKLDAQAEPNGTMSCRFSLELDLVRRLSPSSECERRADIPFNAPRSLSKQTFQRNYTIEPVETWKYSSRDIHSPLSHPIHGFESSTPRSRRRNPWDDPIDSEPKEWQ